ncbi:leucine zipper putative tumor suppressor 1-like [Heptranchias perlo]|uniref:leucine zipper putative tumor suppressor 1-like n=1 Tax=Heptranchias perlo TaxID=212740 RepID=UPI00355A945C
MGSVSSLISGRNFHDKQCKAFEYRNRKASHLQKLIRQQDGLLKFGACHESANSNSKTSSKCERTEDFFYISISQTNGMTNMGKPKNCASDLGGQKDGPVIVDIKGPPPKLVPFSGQLEKGIEKSIVRPTAFKAVVPRNCNTNLSCPLEKQANLNLAFQGNVLGQANHSEKLKGQDQKHTNHSGTLSDSGRNSMSSLPTHSMGCSCETDPIGAPTALLNRFGGSAQIIGQSAGSLGGNMRNVTSLSTSDSGHCSSSKSMNFNQAQLLSQCGSCTRSPLSTNKSVIQDLEEKLAGKEAELQELQQTLEERETGAHRTHEEKQKHCEEEMDGLKQRCSTKMKQACQTAHRTHQLLRLQVIQLQQEKKKLQDDFAQLLQERDKLSTKCKSYEREQTELAPRLEETKWEVCQKSGEISLLKQQLKDSQTELAQKANEMLSLKNQLREAKGKLSSREETVEELQSSARAKARELEVCENERQRMKNAADLLREKVSLLEREILDLKQDLTSFKELNHAAENEACQTDAEKPRQQSEQDSSALQGQVARLKAELEYEKQKNQELAHDFQRERLMWKEEKEKVIQYQKQLQQSYLHMHRQNHGLERAIQQLSIELEARDPVDIEVQSADIHYEEIVATAI